MGVTFSGKDKIDGLKIAFGPQLWWGANPTLMAKYYRVFGDFKFSVLHQEDIAQQQAEIASSVIPQPRARKSTVYFGYTGRKITFDIVAGDETASEGTVYYTLDGSDPGRLATRYRFPIDVEDDVTIKARSYWASAPNT